MELTREAIITQLQDSTRHDLSALSDDAELFSSGLIDSMVLVELMTWMQDEAGIAIDPSDVTVDSFDTITSILELANGAQTGRKRRRRR